MTSSFLPGLRALAAAGMACVFVAACGGGGGSGGGGGAQLPAMLPTAAAPATTGDGAAPEQAPLGPAPCASCAAGGTDVPPAQLNTRLDCAP